MGKTFREGWILVLVPQSPVRSAFPMILTTRANPAVGFTSKTAVIPHHTTTRIVTTLRSTIRDANTHFANASTSYDYIQSDNTHPTYYGATQSSGGSGSGAADGGTIVGGKNPQWNRFGHERMGWALSVFNPATP